METWAIIVATLMGPVLAVQAQKWIERIRAVGDRRQYVFHTLMASRASRMEAEHVRALNMIDLAYYGTRVLGRPVRNAKCQAVIDAWREYFDHLNQRQPNPDDHARWEALLEVRENLFVSLLAAMAVERGLEFDRVQLKKGVYHPKGFFDDAMKNWEMKELAAAVLRGESAIRVAVNDPATTEQDPARASTDDRSETAAVP
ncbi:DUF6680 family protein [Luteimonas sp. SMYT11W]|uniref:DUF6680 family protein n=1 Tax=Luteimonas flava TaxID=3115822 RepID=A0ABU7WEI6_9GAMM